MIYTIQWKERGKRKEDETREYTKNMSMHAHYLFYSMWMGTAAIDDNQLLKEMAWCRAHLLIMQCWCARECISDSPEEAALARPSVFLDSYGAVLARFPMPIQC